MGEGGGRNEENGGKEMGSGGGWSGSVWAKVKKNGRRKDWYNFI